MRTILQNTRRSQRGHVREQELHWIGLLLAIACTAGCGGRGHDAGPVAATGAPAASSSEPAPAPAASEPEAPPSNDLLLLFAGTDDDRLHVERRSVLSLGSPEEQAKLVLSELLKGPSPGLLRALPDGVEVRGVFLLSDGTAWADLSEGILKLDGGSTSELLAIYSLVDTLALNVPQIKQVGILVDGQPRTTLTGHVDLSKPIAPDRSLVAGAEGEGTKGAEPGEGNGTASPKGDGA